MTIDDKAAFMFQEMYPSLINSEPVRRVTISRFKEALGKLERREQNEKTQSIDSVDPGRYRLDPIS